jgi:hypothetical protein
MSQRKVEFIQYWVVYYGWKERRKWKNSTYDYEFAGQERFESYAGARRMAEQTPASLAYAPVGAFGMWIELPIELKIAKVENSRAQRAA